MSSGPSVPAGAKTSGQHAIVFIVLGVGFLVFFFVGLMAQLQTTEIGQGWGASTNIWRPSMEILMQPINFLNGNMSAQEGQAAFVAWVVEFLYLAFSVGGVEVVLHASSRAGQLAGKIFVILSLLGLWYNASNDYSFGTFGTGIGGHLAFAIALAGVVGFFGTLGIFFLEKGWKRA